MRKLIVVLGVMLLATSLASAVMQFGVDRTGHSTVSSGGDVLWSQLDDPTGSAFTDQSFEAPYAAYDGWGAEDFVVTAGMSWDLDGMLIPGFFTVAGANPFFLNIVFYADSGGLPGATACDFNGLTDFTSDGFDMTANLSGCSVDGNVWVSHQARMDFNPFGQHFWATTNTASGTYEGLWKNPGNGFGNGCLDWQPANAVCGMTGVDWMFELTGTEGGGGGEGVPAVGPFGVAMLILALGGGSAYVLRRRR